MQSEKTLANKVCGVVVVAGSLGLIDALKDYYFFITLNRMLPANFVSAYANEKGDVKQLEPFKELTLVPLLNNVK